MRTLFRTNNADAADGVRQAVTWKGDPNLKAIENRPVRPRFHMKNARLFSFRTQNDSPPPTVRSNP